MTARLRSWLIVLFVAFDQLAHMLLAGPKYVLVGGQRPDPDETISGKVGRRAVAGKRWAIICEIPIDALFRALAGERGHCRAAAAREARRKCDELLSNRSAEYA